MSSILSCVVLLALMLSSIVAGQYNLVNSLGDIARLHAMKLEEGSATLQELKAVGDVLGGRGAGVSWMEQFHDPLNGWSAEAAKDGDSKSMNISKECVSDVMQTLGALKQGEPWAIKSKWIVVTFAVLHV